VEFEVKVLKRTSTSTAGNPPQSPHAHK